RPGVGRGRWCAAALEGGEHVGGTGWARPATGGRRPRTGGAEGGVDGGRGRAGVGGRRSGRRSGGRRSWRGTRRCRFGLPLARERQQLVRATLPARRRAIHYARERVRRLGRWRIVRD